MTNVALPEMRRAGYDPGFAAGVIAAGGTLGIMIPPSVIFVLYGIMTETDISQVVRGGRAAGSAGDGDVPGHHPDRRLAAAPAHAARSTATPGTSASAR